MKVPILLLASLVLLSLIYPQSISGQIPKNIQTKDESGKVIDADQLHKKMQSGDWTAKPVFDSTGKIRYMQLTKANKAEKERILGGSLRKQKEEQLIGTAAPPISGLDLAGHLFNSSQLRGKVIVLIFWYLNCESCIESQKEINALFTHYKNDDRVQFLGLTYECRDCIKESSYAAKVSYPIIPDAKLVTARLEVRRYASIIVIDKKGAIASYNSGNFSGLDQKVKRSINYSLNDYNSVGSQNRNEEDFNLDTSSRIFLQDKTKVSYDEAIKLIDKGFRLTREMDKDGHDYFILVKNGNR